MMRNHLWLLVLIVGAAWTAFVTHASPAILEILKAWSGGVLLGALVGAFAGYAAAGVSPDWQWPAGLIVGAMVCVVMATKKGGRFPLDS